MKLYFEQDGSGAPLVLLAGYGCDLTQWAAVRPRLRERHRLLLIDHRGVGRSECPDGPWTIEDMADDVASLLGELGLLRAHVLGHSLGAAVAQTLAVRHATSVDKLVLCSPPLRLPPRTGAALRALWRMRERGVAPELLAEGLLPWIFSSGFLSVPQNIQAVVQMMVAAPFPQTLAGQTRQLEALEGFDSHAWFREIARPTLVVTGEEDICVARSDAQEIAAGVSGAWLTVLPGVAHLPMFEAPAELCRAVSDFCG